MQSLNFPQAYRFDIRTLEGKEVIFDPLRRKYVRLTPEEWVRQHFLQYLIQEREVSPALTAVEAAFVYRGMSCRADILVYSRQGRPVLMAECKAPDVKIAQGAFDQIARYNAAVQARYLVVTNGLTHYCFTVDLKRRTYRFLETVPKYVDMCDPHKESI